MALVKEFNELLANDEIHEHPFFNGQYHAAVWVKVWASTGTNDKPPEDAPIMCAICGKIRG